MKYAMFHLKYLNYWFPVAEDSNILTETSLTRAYLIYQSIIQILENKCTINYSSGATFANLSEDQAYIINQLFSSRMYSLVDAYFQQQFR